MDKTRFMEAVAAKVGKRKPMMRRKGLTGSAPSVVIAIGAPKKPMLGKQEDEAMDDGKMGKESMGKSEKIAALQEKIAALKAELALLEDEDEMDDESEMEEGSKDESAYEDEDED